MKYEQLNFGLKIIIDYLFKLKNTWKRKWLFLLDTIYSDKTLEMKD